MNDQPYISGTGLVTALGQSVDETWTALIAGRFINDHARVDCSGNPAWSRVTCLAHCAAGEAIASAGWSADQLQDDSTALIVGTSKGPIEQWISPPPVDLSKVRYSPAGRLRGFGLHQISDQLAEAFTFGAGPRLTISAACASGLHALIHATMLMQAGTVRRALVVAAEASVHPLFISSFKRLGVLPPAGFGCRPFDVDRAGFLMSEAAAAVCLESSKSPRAIVAIDRFALGGDATHLTGADPSGATLRRLLNHVAAGRAVDLVQAHGTGTILNDPIELAAIESAIPKTPGRPTWIYSHKGALGHTLGAAGLISIVLNAESHRRQLIPPNIRTQNPLRTAGPIISRETQPVAIRQSIAIATGFGGAVAAVGCQSIES